MRFTLDDTDVAELQIHEPEITHYAPQSDPGRSLILVAFARTVPPHGGHLEVLASLGRGYEWAINCDAQAFHMGWAHDLSDGPDGIYVLECRWVGSGEDTDFELQEVRALNELEREYVDANSEFAAVVHAWIVGWNDVPCRGCGKPGAAHTAFMLTCPSVEIR